MLENFRIKVSDFFFKRDETNFEFLVFFRIAIGLFMILHLAAIGSDFTAMFGKYGIIPSDIQEILTADGQITLPLFITGLEKIGIGESTTITIFLTLYVSLALMICMGFMTRISAAILLFLQLAMLHGADLYIYGVDNFATSSLFYLAIFPSGSYFSIDRKLWPNRPLPNLTPYRRVFQLHVCMVYFFSGLAKSLGFNWWNGEAIWKSMHLPTANETFHVDLAFIANIPGLAIVMGISILMIETLYPIFVSIKKTRRLWALLTVGMHLGIGFILGLYFFATIMILWNLTAFYFVPKDTETAPTPPLAAEEEEQEPAPERVMETNLEGVQ